MTTSTNPTARRATIRRDATGAWHFKVQGHNWRTLDASRAGVKRKAAVVARIEKRWPGVEIVVAGEG